MSREVKQKMEGHGGIESHSSKSGAVEGSGGPQGCSAASCPLPPHISCLFTFTLITAQSISSLSPSYLPPLSGMQVEFKELKM